MTARMHRRVLAAALSLALGAALAACSSGGPSYWERLGSAVRDTVLPPQAEPARERSRAELEEIESAVIAVSFGGRRALLVPLADNGGHLDYRDGAGRAVRLFGGAVSSTEGLGRDLAAVRFAVDDPLAHPRPLAAWPARVFREYQFIERDGPQYGITLSCGFQTLARETIEIVELSYDVVRVSEVCANQRREVVNTHWVEPETGFVWKSEQWLGPALGPVTLEVLRPYGG